MWIRQPLEFLASLFGIGRLTYMVLSTHLYLVLRSRPHVMARWSAEEVTRPLVAAASSAAADYFESQRSVNTRLFPTNVV